ncbi:hypothetical protein QFZ82_007568 [Streptomyces sp. V4I23]|nr:hypothetical protein [Streptomyces sp. V4I23]
MPATGCDTDLPTARSQCSASRAPALRPFVVTRRRTASACRLPARPGFTCPRGRFLFTGCVVVLATGVAAAIAIGLLHR